jgi:DNA-binding LacI/PurR family transcriptional regulator
VTTIYDVAREAGVSIGTVSYVINKTKRVRKETAQRVEEAMRRLNYQPHAAAKALALGKTNLITLVYPVNIYEFQMVIDTVTMAIGYALSDTDYRFSVLALLREATALEELEASVNARAMDGVILMHTQLHDQRVDLLKQVGLPFVVIGRCAENEGLHYVDTDIDAAAHLCIQHLVELGYHSIAFVGHEKRQADTTSVIYRLLHAFRHSLAEFDLPIDERFFIGASDPMHMVEELTELLRSKDHPTAIAASNEASVICAFKAASHLGLRIPQDLAVMGFAESPLYPLLPIPCSACFNHVRELGTLAAKMLVTILEGQEPENPQILLPPRLIARASTIGQA